MNNKFKKVISALLVAVMLFGTAPLAGSLDLDLPEINLFSTKAEAEEAATNGTCGENLTWEFDESTGELTISGAGAMYSWSYSSNAPWYDYRSSIKSVIIGDSVTSIGDYAFYGCTSLTSIEIPDSVTSIGFSAFDGCTGLTNIEIPDSVTNIGSSAFSGCTGLTSITIPDRVTSIGQYAFAHCTSLTSVEIPDGVTSIGDSVFYNTAFYNDSTNWEKGVLYIENYLIKAKTSVSGAYSIKKGTKVVGDYAFYSCRSLTSVEIPDSVTNIGRGAFYDCNSLKSVEIGNGVTSIGDSAFYNTVLHNFSSNWENGVLYIGDYLIEAKIYVSGVYSIKKGTKVVADYAFEDCDILTSVEIPDSVISIGNLAFYFCTKLTSVTIGNGVTSIGNYAFYNCSSLTSAYYPGAPAQWEQITIGLSNSDLTNNLIFECNSERPYYAPGTCGENLMWKFYIDGELLINGTGNMADWLSYPYAPWYKYHLSIKSVTIGDSVTSIGGNAFYNCIRLTSIEIPDSVTSIGDSAFRFCSQFTSAYYAGTLAQWEKITIGSNNGALTYKLIFECNSEKPYKATGACGENLSWKLYTDGELVVSGTGDMTDWSSSPDVPWNIFQLSIESVTINSGVTSIGKLAFFGCTSLTSIEIPGSVSSVGYDAFSNTALYNDSTNWRNDVLYIDNCLIKAKKSVAGTYLVKEGTTVIADNAFVDCTNLTGIEISDSVTTIGSSAFCYCNRLEFVHVPAITTKIGTTTFYGTSAYICSETEDCYVKTYADANGIEFKLCEGHGSDGHGHVLGEWVTSVEPTCTSEGTKEKYCTECEEKIKTETVPVLGHNIIVDEAVEATCTATGLTEGQHCSRCNDETIEQEIVPVKAHEHKTVKFNTEKHWKECVCGSKEDVQNHSFNADGVCSCGYVKAINATISIKNNSGSRTINYGETLKLTAVVTNKPADSKIYWYVDGHKKGEGETFEITFEGGTKTVEVKLVDANGNVLNNASNNEIKDAENVTVKAGFFQKLVAFFKKLFGISQTVVQSIYF